jgi:uncharacterized membrane protein
VLLLPPLVVLLGVLVALMLGLRADQTTAWVVLGAFVALGCLVPILIGGVQVATAGIRSRRSTVLLDSGRRTIERNGVHLLAWADVAAVYAHKPNAATKWWAISVRTGVGDSVMLLGRLPPSRSKAIQAAAAEVARELDVEVDTPPELTGATGGLSPHTAGALCYLPFQGIFLLASVWFGLFSQNRFVKFCAYQSLLQFVVAMVLLVPVLGGCALMVAVFEDQLHPGLLGAGMALLLVPYQIWRVGTRLVACWRAYKGRAWVMPWLGFVIRRWAPEEDA